MRRQQARGGVAVVDPQALARLVQVGVDGVLGDAELASDLLGAQVLIDQSQAFALAGGEQFQRLFRHGRRLGHGP